MHIDFSLPWHEPVLVFLLILLIILLVPILLERFKIPSLLGYIIAGLLIGEFGFHLISRNASIVLFGTVGILYLMFIAGLEIDINEFIKNKTKGIIFGILTVIIPVSIGIPVFYLLLDYSLSASILIASIFASHTLVTYPMVSKLGISKNLAVNIAIAGTLIADVTALMILAIVSNNVKATVEFGFWIKFAVSILIFGIIMFWLIPLISRWFFKRVSDNILHYIFVLSVVFLSAFLAMLAGLEPIIGAFFAGLALNRLIPHSSPLMNRIEFIGHAIFIPFFLIGVGMLIDFRVLFGSFNALIIASVMALVAVASKYLAAIATERIFLLSKKQGMLIFALSNSRVAAALAIALIGFDLIIGQTPAGADIHLLDEHIFNAVVIMILVTSTISSFVTQNVGRKIAEEDLKRKSLQEGLRGENTLIGLSNEATAENLLNFAINTIDKKASNRVFGLHIITENNQNNENVNRAKKMLAFAGKHAASADIHLKTLIRYDINIASGIINTVKERHINHFFIGLHEKASIIDSFFGNLTTDLLKKSESSIYIIKLHQPINTVKRFVLILPPKAYLEKGFCDWFKRIAQIIINTGNKLIIYGTPESHHFIKENIKVNFTFHFKVLTNYNDKLVVMVDVKPDTMVIFNLARKHTASYEHSMDNMAKFVTKYFNNISFMFVYPNEIDLLQSNNI